MTKINTTIPVHLDEIWKDIIGYASYQISNLGNVRSLRPSGQYRPMKPHITGRGYLRVAIRNSQGIKRFVIHHLVGRHFIPNPNDLPILNHIDFNPCNNHVSNLEWVDQRGNIHHSMKAGRIFVRRPVDHSLKKFTLKEIEAIMNMLKKNVAPFEIVNNLNLDVSKSRHYYKFFRFLAT